MNRAGLKIRLYMHRDLRDLRGSKGFVIFVPTIW